MHDLYINVKYLFVKTQIDRTIQLDRLHDMVMPNQKQPNTSPDASLEFSFLNYFQKERF